MTTSFCLMQFLQFSEFVVGMWEIHHKTGGPKELEGCRCQQPGPPVPCHCRWIWCDVMTYQIFLHLQLIYNFSYSQFTVAYRCIACHTFVPLTAKTISANTCSMNCQCLHQTTHNSNKTSSSRPHHQPFNLTVIEIAAVPNFSHVSQGWSASTASTTNAIPQY